MTGSAVRAVDLFCGVGGLTHGLERAGVDVVAGVDIDEHCELAYSANNRAAFLKKDVDALSGDQLNDLFGDEGFRLLAGCAPCQPFSTYSRTGRWKRIGDDWKLVAAFGRLIAETKPDFVTMENVPQVADHHVFEAFVGELEDYEVNWGVVQCVDFGVPQTRRRLVLIASRHGSIDLPAPDSSGPQPTVRETIGSLPEIPAGGSDTSDQVHKAPRLSDLNLRRIRASSPGGSWRDWPEDLRAPCHQRASGDTYPSVYGRMEWDAPAPTMTTQCFGYGNGRFGHPEQDRAISLREAAMLQTFPRHYKFVDEGSEVRFNRLGRLIGNAVPVRLGEAVGTAIMAHAQNLTAAPSKPL